MPRPITCGGRRVLTVDAPTDKSGYGIKEPSTRYRPLLVYYRACQLNGIEIDHLAGGEPEPKERLSRRLTTAAQRLTAVRVATASAKMSSPEPITTRVKRSATLP